MNRNLHQGTDKARPRERRQQEPLPRFEEHERVVYPQEDGEWVEQQAVTQPNGRIYPSREEAIEAAREHLRHEGGGELTIRGSNGEIEDKEHVDPESDAEETRVSIGHSSEAEAGFGLKAEQRAGVSRPVRDK